MRGIHWWHTGIYQESHPWGLRRECALRLFGALTQLVIPRLPHLIHRWPGARRAYRLLSKGDLGDSLCRRIGWGTSLDSITLGPWTIQYDADATRAAYAAIAASDKPVCSCAYCRNFWLAQEQGRAFPPAFLALLRRLGVSFTHPAEVYTQAPNDAAGCWYAGWFHFVGTFETDDSEIRLGPIIAVPDLRYDGAFLTWQGADVGCGCWLTLGRALLQKPFTGFPTVQLEFVVDVPWLLEQLDAPSAAE